MGQHVTQLAGARLRRELPPAQVAQPPVLEALRPEVQRPAHVSAVHQVLHVAHGGDEAVGERGHVPHAGLLRRFVHLERLRRAQGERLLAEHVAARPHRGQGQLAVDPVRGGDDDRLHALVVDHGLRVAVERPHVEEGPRLRERFLAPVAKGYDLHPGDEGEPGEVVAERDPANPDDGDADSLVHHGAQG